MPLGHRFVESIDGGGMIQQEDTISFVEAGTDKDAEREEMPVKRSRPFRFKQFIVVQERSAMKVGTDGVLLGAWVRLPQENRDAELRVLDIGTGTGVIALMMAQRLAVLHEEEEDVEAQPYVIDAVEADEAAAREAEGNFAASPWRVVLQGHVCPIQEYAQTYRGEKYDLVLSNPPYFMAGTDFRRGFDTSGSLPSAARVAARHAEMLPYDDLIEAVCRVMADKGRFAAIFPYYEAGIFIAKAAARGLYVARMMEVHGAPHKPVKRVLVELSFQRVPREAIGHESLCIEDGQGNFTEEYRALTRDFYLKF